MTNGGQPQTMVTDDGGSDEIETGAGSIRSDNNLRLNSENILCA